MPPATIISPEDQRATFIELFFDLVFVFSVTKVVTLLHHGLTLETVVQAVLVFWLIWWAWTQFTWALNAADTTHQWVELFTLAATAVAFFMGTAVPDAFHDRALWFAIPYIIVRIIGLTLYIWVASADHDQRIAVQTFAITSVGGLVTALIGALVGGTWQYVFWGLTLLLDLFAANRSGGSENWRLHPEHFCERHGLFTIIALGETLIIAAGGVAHAELTAELMTIAIVAVGITCGLWWSYFVRAKPQLDHAMESRQGAQRSMLARDAYSIVHFPMFCGVIAYALAVEAAVAHPTEPLHLEILIALALGMLLFIGGTAIALWRASGHFPVPRLLVTVGMSIIIIIASGVAPVISLAIALVGIIVIALTEQRWRAPVTQLEKVGADG